MKHIKTYKDFVNESKQSVVNEASGLDYKFLTNSKYKKYAEDKGVKDWGDFVDFLKGSIKDDIEDDAESWLPAALQAALDNKKIVNGYISDFLKDIQESEKKKGYEINEAYGTAEQYVTRAMKNDYVNDVTFKEILVPLAQHLDDYVSRHMGDLEYSPKTFDVFKKLVDLMVADHKEAEKHQ